jgi:thiol-disulfide isomerase/thioredoxin
LFDEDPNGPAALEALTFVARVARAGPGDDSLRAIERMREHCVEREGAAGFCFMVFYFAMHPEAEALIREVAARNPNRTDRGQALAYLANYLESQAWQARRLTKDPEMVRGYEASYGPAKTKALMAKDPERLEAERAAVLERIVDQYGDLPDSVYTTSGRRMGEVARGELFRLRHLNVGQAAPEIAGKDVDGVEFKLSDFRGKVTVLVFSANWCGPCVGMYPQERELLQRHKDEPFALAMVNTDESADTLREALGSGKITARCWWDGGMGPITTAWGVHSFPTIFVLDGQGVIRYKDVRGAELDQAVRALLDEVKRGAPRLNR